MRWICEEINGYDEKWLRFKKGSVKKDLQERDFKEMIKSYEKLKQGNQNAKI